ncbi:unnamed protein product [Ectocarpus sp. CCAP 1310/34]|nr:unnamed protein product [Ectocarpus sp. CCAP 1310/34]
MDANAHGDRQPNNFQSTGWGHSKDKCATEEAVLAQIVHADSDADSVDNQAFCAAPGLPGECGAVDLGLVGVTELGQDVMVYVADTAATCSMFRCANAFVNYRECSGWVKGIGGNKAPVPLLGYGDVTVVFLTEGGRVPVLIMNAAHVPESPRNLLSLSALAEEGHTYSGQKGGLTLTTRAGGKVWFPRTGRRLLWGASKEGPLRHGLERGRTRRETRELQGPEEPPGPDAEPDAEQALLAEIIVDYVSNSLVPERYDEEQVNIEYRREMHELPYGTELQEEAFGAEAGDNGSSQPLHDPQLSIPSPFGQKPSDVECVPLTYKDVLNSKYKVLWEAAIAKEFDGHKKTGTFSEISGLPEGRKAISAKWIFSHKTNEKGLIVDFKARMVARGFSQIPGVDFHHSSSACPSAVSIKTMVAVSTENGRRPVHWDIKQAYTHAKLKEEIYLRLPDGCGVWTGKAVKVERALYGLKQSGREWGFEAADALISNGYEQCRVDPCIFRKVVDGEVVGLIVIYVDDIMLCATEEEREELLASLQKGFPVKDLGDCTWYDGCAIEVDLENGTTKLSQTAYIESMLNRFNVTTTAPTPAVVDDDLGPKRDDESSVDKPVREAIGCLMWLLFTRPDIALPLNKLQKIAHSPTERMWNALVRIMSYLNETKDLGITYVRGSGLDLDVFVDSSYADSTVDRRSTTGLAVTVGGTVVCAFMKTQPVTAQSTTEAEYVAAGEGVKEALFVRGVLSFIAPETSGATIRVREDNEGALALVQNPFSSARSKHIDVRFHFIRELFKVGKITADYVSTEEQHADMLTKVLGRGKLEYHRKALMNLPM